MKIAQAGQTRNFICFSLFCVLMQCLKPLVYSTPASTKNISLQSITVVIEKNLTVKVKWSAVMPRQKQKFLITIVKLYRANGTWIRDRWDLLLALC